MKQLKRLIAVYEETICVKGHFFKVESHRDRMKDFEDDSIYDLYDYDKNELIESCIISFEGVKEIAEAYITGNKQTLNEAKSRWCIAPTYFY